MKKIIALGLSLSLFLPLTGCRTNAGAGARTGAGTGAGVTAPGTGAGAGTGGGVATPGTGAGVGTGTGATAPNTTTAPNARMESGNIENDIRGDVNQQIKQTGDNIDDFKNNTENRENPANRNRTNTAG